MKIALRRGPRRAPITAVALMMTLPALISPDGSPSANAGQSVAIIICVIWPPAEWPITAILAGLIPRPVPFVQR